MRPAALIALSAAACSGPGPTPPRPAAPPVVEVAPAPPDAAPSGLPGIKVSLADVGLEAGSLDRTADPCVDFYQLACGGWLAANDIPVGRRGWSRFAALEEKNKAAIKVLLEEAAKGIGADPATRELGDFYAACMDEAAIEQVGLASIKPLLARTTKVKDAASWLAAVIELHALGVWVVWSAGADQALGGAPTTMTFLGASRVGLADRAHVARTLALAGTPEAKAAAAAGDVVAIEAALAKLAGGAGHVEPLDERTLAKRAKGIDWRRYFRGVGYAPSAELGVDTAYFAGLDAVRRRFTPAQWASYFTYHLVAFAAPQLPRRFRDGAPERSAQCMEETQDALGDLLGQRYAAKYLPNAAKEEVAALVDAMVRALDEHVAASRLGDAAKAAARAQLAKLGRAIGTPDRWRTYAFDVRRDDFGGDRLRARAAEVLRTLARSGQPVDRGAWRLAIDAVGAEYRGATDYLAVPAGLLQAPFFSHDRAIPANLGGLAMLVGHELSHAVDDGDARAQCFAAQYATFEAAPGAFVGAPAQPTEHVADAAGVAMAFDAYRALRADAGKVYIADGFTEDQQFFLGVAQAWCSKDRPEEIQRRLAHDLTAPPRFRVYGALRNLPAFTQAFRCAPGTPMNPTNVCSPW
jgi:putative endopeptidase